MDRRALWAGVAGFGLLCILALSRVSPASAVGSAVTLAIFPETATADGNGVARFLVVATNSGTEKVDALSMEVTGDGAYPMVAAVESSPQCPTPPESLSRSAKASTIPALDPSGAVSWTIVACGVNPQHGATLRISLHYASPAGVPGVAAMAVAIGAHPADASPTPTPAPTMPAAAATFTLNTNFSGDTVLTGDLTSFAFVTATNTSPDPISRIEVRGWRPSGLKLAGSGAPKDCPSISTQQARVPQALASQVAAAQGTCIVLVDDRTVLAPGESRTYAISVTTESRLQAGSGLLLFEVYAYGRDGALSSGLLSQKITTGVFGESAITTAIAIPVFILIPGFVLLFAAALVLRRLGVTTYEPSATGLNTWALAVPSSLVMVLSYEWVTGLPAIASLVGGPRSVTGPHDLWDVLAIWVAALIIGGVAGLVLGLPHAVATLLLPVWSTTRAKQKIEDGGVSEEIAWATNGSAFRVLVRSHAVDLAAVPFENATLQIGDLAAIANPIWQETWLSRLGARFGRRRSGTLTFAVPAGRPAAGDSVVVKLPQVDADHPARTFAWVAS